MSSGKQTAPLHGAVPAALFALTFITGMIDAVSYLGLGHVFVANMTGNVVFLGFGLAGAPGLSVAAALVSFASFLIGAVLGGRLQRMLGEPRERSLLSSLGAETILVAGAAVVAIGLHAGTGSGRRYAVIALLALAMGIRNAVVRGLGVPDMTTTVLTQTSTGLAADSPLGGGGGRGSRRRIGAIASMLLGALAGALLVIDHRLVLALTVIAGLLAALTVLTARVLRH